MDVTLTVEVDCSLLTWLAPEEAAASIVADGDVGTYTPNLDMSPDPDGASWNDLCGTADVVYSSLQSFMTDSDNVLSIAPTTVSSVGTHTVSVMKTNDQGTPDLTTDIEFEITFDCTKYAFDDLEIESSININDSKVL
jgi:hypothetical protein